LTCESAATSGDITVFGHSVKDDPFYVRRLVGNCKQDDYLWPNLTAKEHLDIIGGLRGVDPEEHDEIVQKWLESVDLDTVQHQCSSEFSGGMKRRLSLSLSTIGSRPLIVLDEPTTGKFRPNRLFGNVCTVLNHSAAMVAGMDPVNRRYVWKHIDEIKKGRVVLLTTHAMEEADLLADMVAIMRHGQLAAWGSPLELKSEHGSALQFTALVDKDKVASTVANVDNHFVSTKKWVSVDAGEAGNITVTIQKIQQGESMDGVSADTLTKFVAWLEDSSLSGVLEYGFSNSSLEEVFLKVTEGDGSETQHAGTLTIATNALPSDAGGGDIETLTVDTDAVPSGGGALAEYKPNLSTLRQASAIVWFNYVKTWTGRRSVGSVLMYFSFICISDIVALWLPDVGTALLVVPVILVSLILLSICSGIYGDRAEGMFYLMQANGLLKTSYLLGTSLYALTISFMYSFLLLTGLYLTMFREPVQCTPDYDNNYCFPRKFGSPRMVDVTSLPDVSFYFTSDESVSIYAYSTPSDFGMVFGAMLLFVLTIPGAALSSSYLPGNKFALVVIACLILGASVTPVIMYFLVRFGKAVLENEDDRLSCSNSIVLNTTCQNLTQTDVYNEDLLNCIGLAINEPLATLCMPGYVALLPQFGLFQMLDLALNANIRFYTVPAEYAEESLIPRITGGHCHGSTCAFPAVKNLYLRHAGWQILGAVVLVAVGVFIALVVAFPSARIQRWKSIATHGFEHLMSSIRCRRAKDTHGSEARVECKQELDEVVQERETVRSIIEPLLTKHEQTVKGEDEPGPSIEDHSAITRGDLPPVLTHKLTKVYPSFGRLAPKVALKALDLHVTKGQVLGFLGKNGAGKRFARIGTWF
jgi:ABC-type multidrug transport system ATPase subunit